jgi:hypothetical protein
VIELKPVEPKHNRACETPPSDKVVVVRWPTRRTKAAPEQQVAATGSGR